MGSCYIVITVYTSNDGYSDTNLAKVHAHVIQRTEESIRSAFKDLALELKDTAPQTLVTEFIRRNALLVTKLANLYDAEVPASYYCKASKMYKIADGLLFPTVYEAVKAAEDSAKSAIYNSIELSYPERHRESEELAIPDIANMLIKNSGLFLDILNKLHIGKNEVATHPPQEAMQ